MANWLLNRVLQAVSVALAMTVIVFAAVHMIGNPVDILVSPEADSIERARIIASMGLDQPLWRQYLAFLTGILHGNFGLSFVYGQSAMQVILTRLPATLELACAAMLLAIAMGVPLGLYAGLRPNSWFSRMVMGGSILGFSLPGFWVSLLLIMVFAVSLGWLPTGGRGDTVSVLGVPWSFLTLDGLRHLALPAANLALFAVALVIRLTRAGVQEVLPQEFVKFARAKGLRESRVIGVHVLKNTLIPIVTVLGLEFASMIAFSVVTETVYSWPGVGKLLIDSINVLDRPVIVAYLVLIVVLFVLINLVADLLYTVLDPRIRIDQRI